MTTSKLVVGEVRGEEAYEHMQALKKLEVKPEDTIYERSHEKITSVADRILKKINA